MADEEARPRRVRRVIPFLVRAASVGMATVVAAGLAGEVARDRSAWLGVMMYVPLVVVGVAAIALDVSCRGRGLGLPRARFALAVLGGVGIAAEAVPMIGTGASSPGGDGVRMLRPRTPYEGGEELSGLRRSPAVTAAIEFEPWRIDADGMEGILSRFDYGSSWRPPPIEAIDYSALAMSLIMGVMFR